VTMTRKECEDGLKTGIAALLLALLCWLLSGCTPGGIKMLCGDVNAAGKALDLARDSLTAMLWTDAQAQWTVICSQPNEEERRVCRHRVVDELGKQYKERYNAEAQVIQAQRLLADGLNSSKVCQ